MTWIEDIRDLRQRRQAAVLITQIGCRGHAPREPGVKMVVTAAEIRGTIGGGNLEMTAITRARQLLAQRSTTPEMLDLRLNDKVRTEHARQCCGGEVTILFEPMPVPPAVAIFGVGHVGLELARILSRLDLDLYLTDSRPEQLSQLGVLEPSEATIHARHSMIGEQVMAGLPDGCHVLIMTHDHAEDAHLCDAALHHGRLASIGLIGSTAKWRRIRERLIADGRDPAAVDGISCPIGLIDLPGKHPGIIAISVAADLVQRFRKSEL